MIATRWAPPVIRWFIKPFACSYRYTKSPYTHIYPTCIYWNECSPTYQGPRGPTLDSSAGEAGSAAGFLDPVAAHLETRESGGPNSAELLGR